MHSRLLKLGGLLLTTAVLASAGTYFSEDFDTITRGFYAYSGANLPIGTTFLLTAGSIDVVGAGYFPGLCYAPASGTCVDLNGLSPGTLVSSSFDLPAGNFYLTYVLNGTGLTRPLMPPNQAQAQIVVASVLETFFSQTFTLPYDYVGTWQMAFSVGSAINGAGTRITITSSNPAYVSAATDSNAPATGLVLDAISVSDAPVEGVPEPATVLGGLLTLPLVWAARRRFAR